jgi:hypothetical protein
VAHATSSAHSTDRISVSALVLVLQLLRKVGGFEWKKNTLWTRFGVESGFTYRYRVCFQNHWNVNVDSNLKFLFTWQAGDDSPVRIRVGYRRRMQRVRSGLRSWRLSWPERSPRQPLLTTGTVTATGIALQYVPSVFGVLKAWARDIPYYGPVLWLRIRKNPNIWLSQNPKKSSDSDPDTVEK